MNKKIWKHSILLLNLFIVLLFQQNIAPTLRIAIWSPDFGLIFIFLISHLIRRRHGMIYGFLYGFFYDINSTVMGLMSLSKSVSAYIGGFFEYDTTYNHSNFVYGLLASATTSNLISYGILGYGKQNLLTIFFEYIIPNTLYTVLIGSLLYFIFEHFMKAIYEGRYKY